MPLVKEYINGEVVDIWRDEIIITPYVPQSVSRFQARAILHIDGVLDTVEALVAQAPVITQIAWTDAQEFRRTSPSILAIAGALGWTDAYLDDLFIRAAALEA